MKKTNEENNLTFIVQGNGVGDYGDYLAPAWRSFKRWCSKWSGKQKCYEKGTESHIELKIMYFIDQCNFPTDKVRYYSIYLAKYERKEKAETAKANGATEGILKDSDDSLQNRDKNGKRSVEQQKWRWGDE